MLIVSGVLLPFGVDVVILVDDCWVFALLFEFFVGFLCVLELFVLVFG